MGIATLHVASVPCRQPLSSPGHPIHPEQVEGSIPSMTAKYEFHNEQPSSEHEMAGGPYSMRGPSRPFETAIDQSNLRPMVGRLMDSEVTSLLRSLPKKKCCYDKYRRLHNAVESRLQRRHKNEAFGSVLPIVRDTSPVY